MATGRRLIARPDKQDRHAGVVADPIGDAAQQGPREAAPPMGAYDDGISADRFNTSQQGVRNVAFQDLRLRPQSALFELARNREQVVLSRLDTWVWHVRCALVG